MYLIFPSSVHCLIFFVYSVLSFAADHARVSPTHASASTHASLLHSPLQAMDPAVRQVCACCTPVLASLARSVLLVAGANGC